MFSRILIMVLALVYELFTVDQLIVEVTQPKENTYALIKGLLARSDAV